MKYGDFDVQKIEELLAEYPETLTVEEVAKILKVKKEAVWAMLKTTDRHGEKIDDPLPGYKTGKTWVILRDEFKEWMLRRRNTNN